MKAMLEEHGKQVVFTEIVHTGCHELDVKRILRQAKDACGEADGFLVLSCGAGTQACRAATDKRVIPGCDPLFLGNIQRSMDFMEKCSHCGACVIDDYGRHLPDHPLRQGPRQRSLRRHQPRQVRSGSRTWTARGRSSSTS